MSAIIKALALGGIAAFAYKSWKKNEEPETATTPYIREAGPEKQSIHNHDWDMVDEQADESFPASDPPGNY